MIVQFASDLHLEFTQNKEFLRIHPVQPQGNVLLLAGDIVPFAVMDKHDDFFSYLADHFQATYWVPGNHEYYYFDLATKCGTLNEKIRNNVFLVNNVSVQHENVRFLFSTLWSHISPVNQWFIERGMSDFHVIKYNGSHFTSGHFNELHDESLAFIKQELHRNNTGKTVVVTHHVPTLLNYPAKHKGDVLNEGFAVELYELIEERVPDFWVYGHHHNNTTDFEIGKTKMLTNQLGYVKYNEHQLFIPNKSFTL